MVITITVAGTNVTRLVDYSSLVITSILTKNPDECQFVIKKFGDRTFTPTAFDEVIVTDTDTGDKLFAGRVLEVKEVYDKLDWVAYEVKCTDYTRDMDQRLVIDAYENQTVNQIIQAFKDNYLPNEITINNVDVSDEIQYIAFNYETVSDALRQLAEITDSDWYIDYDKDIHFFKRNDILAPFDLADTTGKYIYESLKIRRNLSQLRNVIIVRGGEYLADTTTAAFIGDATRQNFYLPFKFSNLTLTVTGVEKSVGVDPVDIGLGFDALHHFENREITFRDDRIPRDGSEVRIGGNPNLPVITKMRSTESVGTFTAREYLVVDRSIQSKEGARQRALAELITYKTTLNEGEFQTYQSGLRAGQKINIQSDLRGIDDDFIINKVESRIFGVDGTNKTIQLVHKVTLVTTKTFDHIHLLQRLLNERNREIVITDQEVLDVVEAVDETLNISEVITSSIEHNPISEQANLSEVFTSNYLGYRPEFVFGNQVPASPPTSLSIGLVVKDPASPTTEEAAYKTYLEARSFVDSVTYEDVDTVTEATLEGYDLVVIAKSCANAANIANFNNADVGMYVFDETAAAGLLGLAENSNTPTFKREANITDQQTYFTDDMIESSDEAFTETPQDYLSIYDLALGGFDAASLLCDPVWSVEYSPENGERPDEVAADTWDRVINAGDGSPTDVVEQDNDAFSDKRLNVDTDRGSTATLVYQHNSLGEDWFDNVNNATGYTIEFRVKVIDSGNFIAALGFFDGTYGMRLELNSTGITINAFYIAESTTVISQDMTADYVTVRITVTGTTMKIYVNGTLEATLTLDWASASKIIRWPDAWNAATRGGQAYWDYFKYYTSGNCGEVTVYPFAYFPIGTILFNAYGKTTKRRVFNGIGYEDVTQLTTSGNKLIERGLLWAAGATDKKREFSMDGSLLETKYRL